MRKSMPRKRSSDLSGFESRGLAEKILGKIRERKEGRKEGRGWNEPRI